MFLFDLVEYLMDKMRAGSLTISSHCGNKGTYNVVLKPSTAFESEYYRADPTQQRRRTPQSRRQQPV